MKQLIIAALLAAFSIPTFAQNEVTKFLGIPVDGSKTEMIQKLRAKGYSYDSTYDCLKGEFNGRDVKIYVVTNNNKVYRIMVEDDYHISEADIRIRFNTLCSQFENNGKYLPSVPSSFEISGDEDISYEMSTHYKRYQASYCQMPSDTATFYESVREKALIMVADKYSQEEINNASEEEKEEMRTEMLSIFYDVMVETCSKRQVWFMIRESYGKYYIDMYYDNIDNQANGEEL